MALFPPTLFLMKILADAASGGCRLFQPTVVQGQHTRCVYVGCNSLIVWEDRCICFKTLRKNRCLACNSFPHHWNKAEYSGDAPNGDDVDYKINTLIVIHSQPSNMFIGVHWSNTFRAQSTLNLVVREILVSPPAPTDEKQGASKSRIWVGCR